jgi:hypothetical protein
MPEMLILLLLLNLSETVGELYRLPRLGLEPKKVPPASPSELRIPDG